MSIKNLPAEERPRERMMRYGKEGLSTIELLAVLLGSGTKNRSALELAADLLSHFGSLRTLSEATYRELMEIRGIGLAKAIQLQAAFSLIHRMEPIPEKVVLDAPMKVYQLIRAELERQKIETLMVILRDVRKGCIHREVIAKGTLTELLAHPREVFHLAIRYQAYSLIVAHNHPSGDPSPSKRDLEMTQILASVGKMVGIELSDHLIIGCKRFTSVYEQGLLPRKVY